MFGSRQICSTHLSIADLAEGVRGDIHFWKHFIFLNVL